VKDPSP
jgi:hypothetical protein